MANLSLPKRDASAQAVLMVSAWGKDKAREIADAQIVRARETHYSVRTKTECFWKDVRRCIEPITPEKTCTSVTQ